MKVNGSAMHKFLTGITDNWNQMYADKNVAFELADDMTVHKSIVRDECDVTVVYAGVREFVEQSNENVNDFEFTMALVGLYHEKQHVDHKLKLFHERNIDARCLAVNYYADASSPSYYDANYWHNPREVDAQRTGVMSAYIHCSKLFGEFEANRLICNYVNERIARDSEFIGYKDGKPYDNIDDIVDAFDEAFQHAKHCHREYNPDDAKVVLQKLDGSQQVLPDDSAKFFDKISKSQTLSPIRDQFEHRSGYEQDRVLATAYFTEHPEMRHLLDEYPALQKADLTVQGLCKSFSIPMSVKDKFSKRRDPAVVFDDVLSAADYESAFGDYGGE